MFTEGFKQHFYTIFCFSLFNYYSSSSLCALFVSDALEFHVQNELSLQKRHSTYRSGTQLTEAALKEAALNFHP